MTEPTAPPPGRLLRLRTPADVVEAVPYLLGFHPRNSLVALSLRGLRQRLGLVLRCDLPPPESRHLVAACAAAHLAADGASQAVVAVYAGGDGLAALDPHRPLVDALDRALREQGIGLHEALYVADGRWWSFFCVAACCPAEGTPLVFHPDSPVARAARAWGLQALADRDAVAARLEPVTGAEAEALAAAFKTVKAELAGRLSTGSGVQALREESLSLLRRAVRRMLQGGESFQAREVARLVLGLEDHAVRDQAAEWRYGRYGAAALRLWLLLARRATPPHDLVPLTLAALAVYSSGDGVLARIAVERALERDPDYRLACLVRDVLDQGVHPKNLYRLRHGKEVSS